MSENIDFRLWHDSFVMPEPQVHCKWEASWAHSRIARNTQWEPVSGGKEKKKERKKTAGVRLLRKRLEFEPQAFHPKDVSTIISASRESFLRKTLIHGIAELYSFDFLEIKKRNIVSEATEEVRRSGDKCIASFTKVDSNMLFHVLKDNCLNGKLKKSQFLIQFKGQNLTGVDRSDPRLHFTPIVSSHV